VGKVLESRGKGAVGLYFPKAAEPQPIPKGLCHLAQGCLNPGLDDRRGPLNPNGVAPLQLGFAESKDRNSLRVWALMPASRGSETPGWRTKSLRDRVVRVLLASRKPSRLRHTKNMYVSTFPTFLPFLTFSIDEFFDGPVDAFHG